MGREYFIVDLFCISYVESEIKYFSYFFFYDDASWCPGLFISVGMFYFLFC